MLYQVKRFRLLAALKVGGLGGLIVGALGGFSILPLWLFYRFIQTVFLYDFLPPLDYFTSNLDRIGGMLVYSVGMAIIGAVGGAIAGAITMIVLGFFYNITTRYTGGLMVELEPRGKLKHKETGSVYADKSEPDDDLQLDDEGEFIPAESNVQSGRAMVQHRSS